MVSNIKEQKQKKRHHAEVEKGVSDTQTPSNKKRALKRERQSHRKYFEDVLRAKDIWNKLRTLSLRKDSEAVSEYMSELMTLLDGKLCKVSLQHDASRVVQAMIKYSSEKQGKKILNELLSPSSEKGMPSPFIEMAKSTYAHFIVLKVITKYHRDEAAQAKLYKALKGHVVKLAAHAYGSRVLEVVMGDNGFCKKYVKLLKREFYGKEFCLFDDEADANKISLGDIVANLKDEKKEKVFQTLQGILLKCADKGAVHYMWYHDLLYEYCSVNPNPGGEVVSGLVDHAIHLMSTRNGTLGLCKLIAHGSAKDRKKVVKTLKGYSVTTLEHPSGYLAILKLLRVTDDTVLIQKNILTELTSSDEEDLFTRMALEHTSSKLFLSLLNPEKTSNFDPFEIDVVFTHECPSTSKKSDETRAKELLQFIQPKLINMCKQIEDVVKLLTSRCGGKVLINLYSRFGADIDESLSQAIFSKIELFEDPIAQINIKNLLTIESSGGLAKKIVKNYEGKLIKTIGASNRGAFCLNALLQCEDVSGNVLEELRKDKKKLQSQMNKSDQKKGYELLLENINKVNKNDDDSELSEDEDKITSLESVPITKTPSRRKSRRSVANDDDSSVASMGSIYSAEGGTPLRRSARKAGKGRVTYAS